MSSARKRAYQHKAYAEIAHMKQKLMLKERHFSVMEQMNKILAAKYDEQTAKLAEAQSDITKWVDAHCDKVHDVIALQEQLAEAKKDAERLDYLQQGVTIDLVGTKLLFRVGGIYSTLSPTIREAIDAAIRAMKEE